MSFANRYFALPEEWDEDDIPLIMFFVKCRICGSVREHYIREGEYNMIYNWGGFELYFAEGFENFIYNWDNTFISLSEKTRCGCGLIWNYKLEYFLYSSLQNAPDEDEIEDVLLDSKLEELFWNGWKEKCHITLMPQYNVGRYRIDFAHLPSRTAIELDGKQYHSTPQQIFHDNKRQAELERAGWRFIRFNYFDIEDNLYSSIVRILNFIGSATNIYDYQHF